MEVRVLESTWKVVVDAASPWKEADIVTEPTFPPKATSLRPDVDDCWIGRAESRR